MNPKLTFSEALALLRLPGTPHARIAREGWNGKGMWIVRQDGYPDGVAINRNTAEATGIAEGTTIRFLPYIMMKTADGAFVPWLANQTDILADDWIEVTAYEPVVQGEQAVGHLGPDPQPHVLTP